MIIDLHRVYMFDIQGFDYENADEEDDGTFEVIPLQKSHLKFIRMFHSRVFH